MILSLYLYIFSYCNLQQLVSVNILYSTVYILVFLWLCFGHFCLVVYCVFSLHWFGHFGLVLVVFCLVVHGCNMVIHMSTYYQVLHKNPQGMRTVPVLHGVVGNKREHLSHFCRFNNLIKFKSFKQWSRIRKDHDLGLPPVKLQLMMSSQRIYMIIFLHPTFELGWNLRHFGLCVLVSTRFLQSFGGLGSKSTIWKFVLGRTGNLKRNNIREDKSWWENKEEDHYSVHKIRLA